MTISWRAAAAALDAGTALFAAVNAAYFASRLLGAGDEPRARRTAILVLALVSLAALVEALVLLAALPAYGEEPLLSTSQWFSVRVLACVASGGVFALILRRIVEEN